MDLSETNFEKLFPDKMGIVKKMMRFQQTVNMQSIQYNYTKQ